MEPEPSLEGLIASLNKRGWLITELYQRSSDEWFAALRRTGDFSSAHGEGTTPNEALSGAIAQIKPHMTSTDWDQFKVTRPSQPRYRLGDGEKIERVRIKRKERNT